MPKLSIFHKTLRDLRWQVWWYGIGLAALSAMVVYIYPSYREELASFDLPEALKALIGNASYATPNGFLTAEFFSWGPMLGIVFAIMAGTSALGGEEANGTLDLLLAQPISRKSVILQKMAGFAVAAIALAVFIDVGWLLSVPFVDIEISLTTLLPATFLLVPEILLVYAFAVFVTALLPDRKLATGCVTFVVVACFFANYLAALVHVLSPLRWVSFFNYARSDVLITGVDYANLGVMLGSIVVLASLGIIAFDKRDIGVRSGLKLPAWLTTKRESDEEINGGESNQTTVRRGHDTHNSAFSS